MDFYYDGQMRRYLAQFIRLLSHFYVETGKDSAGNSALIQVPVKYGDISRQVASIIRKNSENALNTVPQISCYVTNVAFDRDRIQSPTHVDKVHIKERFYDKDTQAYTAGPGDSYTIERSMPSPYRLTVNADIWTSNTEQKMQITEQMFYMFNPSLEIQTTDNYVDWTSLSYVELTEIAFSNRTVPVGTDDMIDIATMTFEIPIWINPPAIIKRLGVISKVVMGIFDGTGDLASSVLDDTKLMGSRQYYTPLNYGVLLLNGELKALHVSEPISGDTKEDVTFDHVPVKYGTNIPWKQIIAQYGDLKEGISQVKLLTMFQNNDTGEDFTEVIGTVAYNATDETILDFTVDVDTIPANTQGAINAVINPLKNGPGDGLPAAATGQRYLILEDIGSTLNTAGGPTAWPDATATDIQASKFDIIEFDGTSWSVDFDASSEDVGKGIHYVTNTMTGIQYKWTGNEDTAEWIKSYEGEYLTGLWSISLLP
jgi:hypothetical protein